MIHAFREWLEPFSEFYSAPRGFIEVEICCSVPNRVGHRMHHGIRIEDESTWIYEVRVAKSQYS